MMARSRQKDAFGICLKWRVTQWTQK